MADTKIEWTDKTWNPVTGCTKVSTGCKHCYAERLFPRVYGQDRFPVPQADGSYVGNFRQRKFTDVKLHPDRLDAPLHWKKPRMIFVNSMSDLFHEDIPFEFIAEIFNTMSLFPVTCRKKDCEHDDPNCFMGASEKNHTYQILTKRPKRALEFFDNVGKYSDNLYGLGLSLETNTWPLENVWLGISCENQATADERIPILLQVPAAVRFLSCEPLLEKINLKDALAGYPSWPRHKIYFVDWVIVGGESGAGYRPMKPEWAKSIIEQCQAARVPVFMKQMAGKKEIPEDLQIREYPECQKE